MQDFITIYSLEELRELEYDYFNSFTNSDEDLYARKFCKNMNLDYYDGLDYLD